MTRKTFSILVVLLLGLSALACESGDNSVSNRTGGGGGGGGDGDADGDGDGDGVKPDANECGSPGEKSCYCRDGSLIGTQQCKADGTLTKCECPYIPDPIDTGPDTDVEESDLCLELRALKGCELTSFKSVELPASILFVIDRSASMNCNPPPLQKTKDCSAEALPVDPKSPSKWDVTIKALKDAFSELKGKNGYAGLAFFSNDNQCGVASGPAVSIDELSNAQLDRLAEILDKTDPKGGTPIVGATILAYQHLHEEAADSRDCPVDGCPCDDPPCGAPGNRFVVLITDGEESCAGDKLDEWMKQLLDDEAPKALKANVRTFVVGAPGSEGARGFLSELAFKGGTAPNKTCSHDRTSKEGDCHFDMTETKNFADDLAKVLDEISGTAVGCEFTVPPSVTPTEKGNVNVQYTPTGGGPICLFNDTDKPCKEGANGWQFAKDADGNDDLSKVVLCGEACTTVESDKGVKVDVLVGCQSIPPPV